MSKRELQDVAWIYERLVCELDHYDICLRGIVDVDGELMFCRVVGEFRNQPLYTLHAIDWNDKTREWFEDYKQAYAHWVYDSDRRRPAYDGRSTQWFSDKWRGTNYPLLREAPVVIPEAPELLPCPFCGAKADPNRGFHEYAVIGCSGADCPVDPQTTPCDSYAEAAAAWNRRTDHTDAEKYRVLMRSLGTMPTTAPPAWDSRDIRQ